MNNNKTYILIRHAESKYNVQQTDHWDSDLTETGFEQAKRTATHLKDLVSGFCGYVSPYLRTLKTANIIQETTGIKFKVLPNIGEYGASWNSKPYDVIVSPRKKEFPQFDWLMFSETVHYGGESFKEFLDRMKKVLDLLPEEKILLVSHGAVVYTLVDLLTNGAVGVTGYGGVPNASVSIVRQGVADGLFVKVMN